MTPSAATFLAWPLNVYACLFAALGLLPLTLARTTRKYLKLPIVSTGYLALVLATGTLTVGGDSFSAASSPVMLAWPSLIITAGLFSAWLPAVIAAGLTLATFLMTPGGSIQSLISYVFGLAVMPLAIASVIRFAAATTARRTHRRRSQDYKKPSSEIERLIDESSGLIRALGDGVLAIDSQELVRFINPAAERILGWSRADGENLQYQSILKLAKDDGVELVDAEDPIKQTLNNNQEVRASSLQLETKNGKKLFVAVTVSPLGDSGSGVVVIFRDITRDVAENRQQAEFISTASHEMRTPVASIEGYLGLALNPSTAQIDDRARNFIVKAHESAQHLGRLFQDLLDVSKSEDGRLKSSPRVFDVVNYVGEVIQGLQPKASEKGLSLTFKPAASNDKGERKLSPVLYVNLDQDHVRELVNNLTENAIKYTPSGQVTVDVKGVDNSIEISIEDSGVGIPEEDIPHLFQKFYRVDSTDTREIGGTGLGLFLARRLAESLGGSIDVKSRYGQGSTFTVTVPRIEPQAAQQLLRQQQEQDIQRAEQASAQAATAQPARPAPAEQPTGSSPPGPLAATSPPPAPPVAPTGATIASQSAPAASPAVAPASAPVTTPAAVPTLAPPPAQPAQPTPAAVPAAPPTAARPASQPAAAPVSPAGPQPPPTNHPTAATPIPQPPVVAPPASPASPAQPQAPPAQGPAAPPVNLEGQTGR